MKVLHIITRMNTGGPAVFLDHLTEAIPGLDCESVIAYGYCEGNESDYTDNHKLSIELIKIKSLHRSLNLIDDIRAFFQIRKIIRKVKPDLVNTHTSKAGVLGRIAAKSVNKDIPVVHSYLGHLIYGYFNKFKLLVFILIERFMAFFTDAAVAVTTETMSSLVKSGVGIKLKWKVIKIGLPKKEVEISPISSEMPIKILWVGRFTDIKDPFFALNVFQELYKNSPCNFSLTMIGGGELLDEVKNAAKDLPIQFTGWVINPFANFIDFDVLMLTSKNEGLPLVILEAASFSRASISRDVGGVSEFIKDGKTGYLVSNDPKEMAEKIINISLNKIELKIVGERAGNLLETDFSAAKMANEYYDLYLKLIE
jgi:glycosyltransferase involved in cell wall biosynthesis